MAPAEPGSKGRHQKAKRADSQPAALLGSSKPVIVDSPTDPKTLPADAARTDIQAGELAFNKERRYRDKAHLKFAASHPCLVCSKSPADAHHLRFAQPRAMGLKVSDEFTVPLCRANHQDNHRFGDEQAWWIKQAIDALTTSRQLWASTSRIDRERENSRRPEDKGSANQGRFLRNQSIKLPKT